ncbi:MAG: hypothetical protein KGL39_03265 [Patescibacteria group bacterium]|nr:hypothetical protein [Patescibacteria group bacterium]
MADVGIQQVIQSGLRLGRLYGAMNGPLTAHAGGGQANAVPLKSLVNDVATVASANDSLKLPVCEAGRVVIMLNNGANAAQVFSDESTGVDIDSTAGSTGVSVASSHVAIFVGAATGTLWSAISVAML